MTIDTKPSSMSMKSFLIRKLSVSMMMEEQVLECVINHQFLSALDAISTSDEIEISGFGKFHFNYKKALKKYEKELKKRAYFEQELNKPNNSQARINSLTNKLQGTNSQISSLYNKLNQKDEYRSDLRRMEEQAVPFFPDGGGCSQAEAQHLL